MSRRLLIVDDDRKFLTHFVDEIAVDLPGFSIDFATTPEECLEAIRRQPFEVVLLDIQFRGENDAGLALIPLIHEIDPSTQVIMLSSLDNYETISKATSLGAADFASKVHAAAEVAVRVNNAVKLRQALLCRAELASSASSEIGAVFKSTSMREVFTLAAKAKAATDVNVLIMGPTGAGKEMVALAISRKAQGAPFLALNCAAFSSSLLDSELFGHERGAFTGAYTRRAGKLEAADGGDIFLDEIDSLSLEAQAKLLRALESKEITPLGGNNAKKLTFRIIAATNADIEAKVKTGKFRKDLLARLNAICIDIPPLAHRPDDIPALVQHFIAKSVRPQIRITAECMQLLRTYTWPDNVRQLRQVLTAMIALADGDILGTGDVPEKIRNVEMLLGAATTTVQSADGSLQLSLSLDLGRDMAMEVAERSYIQAAMQRLDGDASQVELAKVLKVPRSTLQRRLQELGLANQSGCKVGD